MTLDDLGITSNALGISRDFAQFGMQQQLNELR